MEQKLQEKQLILSATQASLTAELQNLQSLGTQRERELEALRAEHTECQRKAMHVEQKFAVQKEVQESTITRLRGDLDCALRDRAALENEKSELQEEMVKIQGNFQEINQNLEVEVAEKKLELASVQSALLVQEQENKRLMECVALLEQEQHSRRQVEMLLNELMESKNKLAYEKGKLQSTVEQLKAELQSLGDANNENSQLRKLNTALETKYTQANAELGSCRIRLQRAEARLQQAQSVLLRKEEDFTLAIKARDETLKEETRLRGQLEVAEEREEQNMSAMQQQLSEVREERNRMSSMLENVVTSHTQLQQDLEKLQTELGHRDSNIAALLKERDHCQKQIKTLEGELSEYQAKLQSIESQKHAQIAPLHRAMEVAHEDNKTLAHALEQALQKSSSLQIRLNELEKDLKRKEFQEQQMEILRAQAEEDIHIQQQQYEERITTLKKQHLEECKETKRAARRDMAELKKVLDCATAKSAELSRTNRELRNSKSEHEKTVLDQKNLIHSLRTQLKTRLESKAAHRETDRVQLLEAELKHMKQVKAEFEKSNKEQSKLIEEFMAEVESLRRAIKASSQNAEGTALCSQLETETQLRKKLEYKCKGLQQRVQELQEEKNLIEEKLRKASVESEQISRNLEEAHSWFQSQFEELQLENQEKRQQDINHSPLKSTLVDSRGNNMENLQRLPYSAVSHFETKEKLKLISRNYQSKEANSNPTRTECDMPS
ncbi:Hypothetical predicted protein [Pelobates cultripes]|uniref:Coiled-coil domain containing 150 n=1 Tax=Pelobates cultripes TaxID=61616 RepID=A0AAD1RCH9_PELCU|nr:Hypothetical predicted protein [Pelobates cultripes]